MIMCDYTCICMNIYYDYDYHDWILDTTPAWSQCVDYVHCL